LTDLPPESATHAARGDQSGAVPHATPHATLLLKRASEGDAAAAEALLPLVYRELRARAGAYFRGQPANHTLQPTALVHEAFLKLINVPGAEWRDRAHFCAVAATAMRQILTDHARRRAALRRAHEHHYDAPTQLMTPAHSTSVDLIVLDDALNKLAQLDERQARIIELRFFGSLSIEETAGVMNVSVSTIEKEWRRVRAWLIRELSGETRA
jgi:RNA polymerase sigma factor (TIGR02999 family)